MKSLFLLMTFLFGSVIGASTQTKSDPACLMKHLDKLLKENLFKSPSRNAVTRNADQYFVFMGTRFAKAATSLTKEDHFLDLGAGEAVFARELAGEILDATLDGPLGQRTANKIPRVSAVSYKVEDKAVVSTENFRVFKGKYFEDIPNDTLTKDFGPVTMAVDHWGVLAYTYRPTEVLKKLHAILRDNGEVFVRVGPREFDVEKVSGMSGRSKGFPSSLYSASVKMPDGNVLRFPDWIEKYSGFKVQKVEDGKVYVLKKKKGFDSDKIPELKVSGKPDDRFTPPGRTFEQEE